MPDEIVFRFLEDGIAAPARLLPGAPETCRAVLDALPAVPLRFSKAGELADDAAAFFASNPAEELA